MNATWLIILSGTLYGFLGFFGTQLLKMDLTITTMLFWRFYIAAIWMLCWEFYQNRIKPRQHVSSTPVNINAFLALLLAGIFYCGSSVFYFYASKETGTGLAMVIFFSYPIFVASISSIKNISTLNRYSLTALFTILLGLFLLQRNRFSPISLSSIFLALLAALSYALYIINSKKTMLGYKSQEFTLIICTVSALVFLLIAIFNHEFTIPHSIEAWGYFVGLGIFATAIPIQLLLDGLKSVSSLKASILSALEPVVTLLIGVLALGEGVSSLQLLGVVVIILGTLIIQFAS